MCVSNKNYVFAFFLFCFVAVYSFYCCFFLTVFLTKTNHNYWHTVQDPNFVTTNREIAHSLWSGGDMRLCVNMSNKQLNIKFENIFRLCLKRYRVYLFFFCKGYNCFIHMCAKVILRGESPSIMHYLPKGSIVLSKKQIRYPMIFFQL